MHEWNIHRYEARACHVHVLKRGDENVAKTDDLEAYQSPPLKEKHSISYVLMSEVLQELQLSVGSLGQDGRAERLHNLLDGHGLAGKLIFGRAGSMTSDE